MIQQLVKRRLLLFVGLLIAAFLSGQAFYASANDDGYDFPVVPGTSEWKELRSHAEMREVTQVPREKLADMSTAGLVSTVQDYPLYGDYLAFNSLQQGYEAVARFNGIDAMMTRKGAASELANRYIKLDLDNASKENSLPSIYVGYNELLLAQPQMLNSLSKEERSALYDNVVSKLHTKFEKRTQFNTIESLLLAGRILQMDDAEFQQSLRQDDRLQNFLEEGGVNVYTEAELEQLFEQFDTATDSK